VLIEKKTAKMTKRNDITERKRMEEELRESEEKYRAIVENSPNFIGILQDGVLKYVNRAATQRLGWTYEELVSLSFDPIEKVVAERFRGLIKENVGKRLRGEDVPPYEISLTARDGSEIPVMVRAAKIVYQGRPAIEFAFSDITERKRMEEELSRSSQFLGSVIENAYVWLNVLDNEQNVLVWNKAAEAMSGYSREEVVGHGKIWEWLYPDREHRKQITETVTDVLQSGRTDVDVETKIKRKDGQTRIISWNERALTDQDGKAIGTIAIGHDITERRRMEERVRSLHKHALQLTSATSIEEIAKYTLDAAEFALGFDWADVLTVENGYLKLRRVRGPHVAFSVLPLNGPGISVRAANTKSTVRVSDTRKDAGYVDGKGTDWKGPPTMLSEIAVPVITDNEVVAVLNVESTQLNAFTYDDQALLETLAAHVASDMKRLEHERELENYSKHLEALVEERTKRLLESEERYRSIVQNIPAMVWASSEKGDTVFITPNVKELYGYTPEEIYAGGRPVWSKHIHPDDRAKLNEAYHALFADGRVFDVEYRYQRPDGTWLWLIDRANLVYEKDGVRCADGVTTDITRRKQTETALLESEERFRGIAERSVDEIFEADLEGRLTYASPAVQKILGYKPGEVVGTLFHKYLSTSELPKAASSLTSLRAGKNIEGVQFCALKKDGSQVFVEVSLAPIVTDGKVVGAQGTIRDLTERRKIEERLHQAERLAVVGETAAMVGHDLRNPLQGIAGALHLLRQESLATNERDEMLQLIQSSVEYADAIVRDLSEYSTEIILELADTTPKSLTREAMQAMKVPSTVSVQDLSQNHPTLKVDTGRIKRALVNLIENAIDAMPQGGTLTISSRLWNDTVEIALSDTGSGMPEKVMENLWRPLQTTKAKGLGLGLPICKRIVDAHGGTISVKSKAGEGTTVTIRLPIKPVGVEVKRK
jgi:two-component system sporulation sensor kinase A